jgi:hypothetical protein
MYFEDMPLTVYFEIRIFAGAHGPEVSVSKLVAFQTEDRKHMYHAGPSGAVSDIFKAASMGKHYPV